MSAHDLLRVVADRGIQEILHFTTNRGLTGTLASRTLKSRARLPEDRYLEYIFEPNALLRKDLDWLDYVNLSISAINGRFFDVCESKWHVGEDIFWVVLAFDPVILAHDGVVFTTTNNMYTGVHRDKDTAGLLALFDESITRWTSNAVRRPGELDRHMPTDEQAEVLYPGELSTRYLRTIYAPSAHAHDLACAQLKIFPHEDVKVIIDPLLRRRN
ncbi:MAG TPA: DarT ssDNA thymidine ADP-ribosyltransferase family protein [Chloroflexota bacterium]|nr:DarT ssDNA thymidine ADP-ribosyltransferase family protein [Chloroflexota bacterium]